MRVRVKSYGRERDYELEAYLTPAGYHDYGSGELEDMKSDARATAEVMGRLLAKLVDNRTITLEEAVEIAGKYDDVELIKEH